MTVVADHDDGSTHTTPTGSARTRELGKTNVPNS